MTRAAAVVVGAGPAGLAAAAMLGQRGIPALILERDERPAASWHRHYRSLRLHTVRALSSLPGRPIPRSCGRWVSRGDFVAYLERYAAAPKLRIHPGTPVHRIQPAGHGWRLAVADPQSGNRVFTRHLEEGRIPILDIGSRNAVRAYRLRIVPAVEAVQNGRVTLRGGVSLTPDAVVAATGYRPDLGSLVGDLGVLDERGLPAAGGREIAPGGPALYFAGYRNPLTGALRELRFEAPAIADAVAAESR